MTSVVVRVPASSANLGPGFDCLGLALDLWNETTVSDGGSGIRVENEGAWHDRMGTGADHLVVRAVFHYLDSRGLPRPQGLAVHCRNRIPPGSGLGSSAAAVLTGLLAGSALAGDSADPDVILPLAAQLEGHADNAAPALLGGLTAVATGTDGRLIVRKLPVRPLVVAVSVPDLYLPTRKARAALPRQVLLADAAANAGRMLMVTQALAGGDLDLLARVMDDNLHQPYRLPLIPGAHKAMQAAREAGAAAVALSGAGPGLLAFCRENVQAVAEAMTRAFESEGLDVQGFVLPVSHKGAIVETGDTLTGTRKQI
jgi:homoserine kinase